MFYSCLLTFCFKHSFNIRQTNVKKIPVKFKFFSKKEERSFPDVFCACRDVFLPMRGFFVESGMFLYENCTDLQRFLPVFSRCFLLGRRACFATSRSGREYIAGYLFLYKSINNVYPVFLFVKCVNVCFSKKVFNTASFPFNGKDAVFRNSVFFFTPGIGMAGSLLVLPGLVRFNFKIY